MAQVFVVNSGSIQDQAFANPGAVPEGMIAAFAEGGAILKIDSASTAAVHTAQRFFFAFGGADNFVRKSFVIDPGKVVETYKKAYSAPVKQHTKVTGIAAASAAGTAAIKIVDLTVGVEQFPRVTAEISVPNSQTAAVTIEALVTAINSIRKSPVVAFTNKTQAVTLTGTGGAGTITISETAYAVTFDTDLTDTAANFVTDHAATILANHGYTVTSALGVITFTPSTTLMSGASPAPTFTNASGNLAGAISTPQAATELHLRSKALGTSFSTHFDPDDQVLSAAVVASVAAPQDGSGSYAQVAKLERDYIAKEYGQYYVNDGLLGRPEDLPVYASSSKTYDIYVMRVEVEAFHSGLNTPARYEDIYVCLATSGITGDLNDFFVVS